MHYILIEKRPTGQLIPKHSALEIDSSYFVHFKSIYLLFLPINTLFEIDATNKLQGLTRE